MAASDHTERQDDSAINARAAASHVAHVRCTNGDRWFVRELDPSGLVFGRDGETVDADITFDDARMSRRHARIERHTLAWRLVDLGSRNGAYVDGASIPPLGEIELRDGAVVRLGDSLVVFRAEAVPAPGPAHAAFPGESPSAAAVRRRLARLATATGHVLLLGETGTGKERAARTIAGDAGSFVPQNCAELSRELVRSELFGHLRGAFSGATVAKPGLVEVAADGVLFLDEIGELALDVQGDLLRFLEDGSYRPIGATELRHSNARIVAATNVDLDDAVRRGAFRRDLLARLRASNAPLELPPLRDRREDILPWAGYFLREAGVAVARAWNAGAAECLMLYPWLENLRELRGVVRGLVAAEAKWPISSNELPDRVQAHRRSLRTNSDATPVPPPIRAAEPSADEIIATLARTNGRMRTASEQLGIERTKLYRLCQQHGIDFGSYRSGPHAEED